MDVVFYVKYYLKSENHVLTLVVCMIRGSQASCGNMLLKTRCAYISTLGLRFADHTPQLV